MPIEGLPGGDFAGCVAAMSGEMDNPEAFCAWKTRELTGKWPTEEADGGTVAIAVSEDTAKELLTALNSALTTEEHGEEPAEPETATEAQESFHETFNASLTIRESKQPNTVLLDGVIISEGRSANHNDYTLEALNSGPRVFANKPIRVNHPSRSDDRDRPEGDVWTQVGKLPDVDGFSVTRRGDGKHELRFTGAILSYSEADRWIADRIRAGIIGDMSINAGGKGVREANGFKVTEFTEATSHDLVTVAAAGGKATALHESDGGTMKKKEATEAAVTAVMESAKLPAEVRPLIEAEAARLTEMADGEEEKKPILPAAEGCAPTKEAPAFLADLPDAAQTAWVGAYDQCMAGGGADEAACSNSAWLAVVKALAPAEAPPATEVDATPAEDEKEEPAMTEALAAYAKRLKAALAKVPGVGSVQGMGTGATQRREAAPAQRDPVEWMKESYSKIPGFTPAMAEIAAKGR